MAKKSTKKRDQKGRFISIQKSSIKKHITFSKKVKRFRAPNGRFISKSRGMRSIYGRKEYKAYIQAYRPARGGYEKIEEGKHKEAGTKDKTKRRSQT